MANIDLKNLNIEDLKEQILKFADKKTLIKIGIGFGGLIILGIGIIGYFLSKYLKHNINFFKYKLCNY